MRSNANRSEDISAEGDTRKVNSEVKRSAEKITPLKVEGRVRENMKIRVKRTALGEVNITMKRRTGNSQGTLNH